MYAVHHQIYEYTEHTLDINIFRYTYTWCISTIVDACVAAGDNIYGAASYLYRYYYCAVHGYATTVATYSCIYGTVLWYLLLYKR